MGRVEAFENNADSKCSVILLRDNAKKEAKKPINKEAMITFFRLGF